VTLWKNAAILFGLLFILSGCGSGNSGDAPMTIALSTPAFKTGESIPKEYTGEGKDISPPLKWSNVPQDAKELALICDDPDAPVAEPWVHWVIYNIPAANTELPEGVASDEKLNNPAGAAQGVNDFSKSGYRGPMPPPGHGTHHYHFKLYALDKPLKLESGLKKKQLLAAMKGHIVAQGELIGTYERKK
jgi:Raf kinase inhibitor-like YbhB/YbcL family protein